MAQAGQHEGLERVHGGGLHARGGLGRRAAPEASHGTVGAGLGEPLLGEGVAGCAGGVDGLRSTIGVESAP